MTVKTLGEEVLSDAVITQTELIIRDRTLEEREMWGTSCNRYIEFKFCYWVLGLCTYRENG
jgi:hypothetical protein